MKTDTRVHVIVFRVCGRGVGAPVLVKAHGRAVAKTWDTPYGWYGWVFLDCQRTGWLKVGSEQLSGQRFV
jgi:hypothetical protein